MQDKPPYALLLKRKETQDLFDKYLKLSNNCFPLMRDLLNALIEVPNKQKTLEALCEFISACKLSRMSIDQFFIDKNMIEEGKYQADNMQIEALRSSWQLLRSLNQELALVNLSLSKH